jgi:cell division protein FtsI/penicillin-binding protein 2
VIRLAFLLLTLCSTALTADLDSAIRKVMHGRVGTAVVVNVASGKILGSYRLDMAEWKLARPGSAFKPFTLLALLESGKLKSTDSFTCRRNLHVGTHDLSCSHPRTGPIQAVPALAYSCNDFFATMGSRLTAEELRSVFHYYGLASPSSLVSEEASGSINLARTVEERQLQAIGEGEMRVTPLEMLAAYRKLALRRFDPQASEAMRTVLDGLEAGTQYGMARSAAVTGVKVAVVVFLEKGTGPGDAAPLAAEIFEAFFQIWGKN